MVYLRCNTRDGISKDDIKRTMKKGKSVDGPINGLMCSLFVSETNGGASCCPNIDLRPRDHVNAVVMWSLKKYEILRVCNRVGNTCDPCTTKIEKGMLR